MKRSLNLPGRSSIVGDAGPNERNALNQKEGKRKRRVLGEKTNLTSDLLQNSKRSKHLRSEEDKENIPPADIEFPTFAAPKPLPLSRKVHHTKEQRAQPLFACDIARCREDGHLFTWEYVVSVSRAMVKNEKRSANLLPNPDYFLKQTNIRPRMRTILFSWMTEVHIQFELREVVLWASFQICDRFLSKVNIHREKLQLVGCTCIWIASKYHEIYPPLATDLVHMSDKAFTKDDIIAMECQICKCLSYKFSIPNAFQFLDRFTEVAVGNIKEERLKNRVKFLARYAMERFHMQVKALQYCPSLLAAGALFAALKLTSHRWTSLCEYVSGYSESKLFPKFAPEEEMSIFEQIKKAVMNFNSSTHQAIILKYRKADRGSVSTLRKKEKTVMRQRTS
jgi:hypothetical protein